MSRNRFAVAVGGVIAAVALVGSCRADAIAIGSAAAPSRFVQLEPGAVKPDGWLREQLRLQAEGLTGHAEELYDDIGKSTWLTHEKAKDPQYDWERGPYYARGLLALAWQLDDAMLKEWARKWVMAILDGQLPNGDIGPRRENWWANMLALYIVRDWYRISGDVRCLDFIARYARFLQTVLPKTPLMADFGDRKGGPPWAAARGGDLLEVMLDVYDVTKDGSLLDASRLVASQTAPWTDYYHDGAPNWAYQQHIVNFNQGLKTPALLWRLGIGDTGRNRSAYQAATAADGWVQRAFGRPDAMQNGEEPLRDRETTGGTELCAQAERIISCADQIAVFGDALAADDLETVAYNCLPATLAPDGKGLRYYLNLNQPKCTNERTDYCHNGQKENCLVPSPHSGFGCCRSNFHIAWPKFVQSMWMKVVGGGYAAVAYGPCRLETEELTVVEKTDYPFRGRITLTVEKGGGRFPIFVRVPRWAREPDAGTFRRIDRLWRPGEEIALDFASEPIVEKGWNRNAAVVRKGPLLFAWPVKNKEKVTADFGNGFVTRELLPAGAFNVALDLRDGFHPDVVDDGHPLPHQPFTADASPIRLRVKGCRTDEAEWGQFRIGAPALPNEPPPSPIRKAVDFGLIDLVPLGCTQTRITFFPWVDSTLSAYPIDVADLRIRDPFVVAQDGNYFLYESKPWNGGKGVNVFESKDLIRWSKKKSVLSIPDEIGNTAVWAPEVHHYRGKWYLFVTLTMKPNAWEIKPMPTDGFNLGKLQPRGTWIYVSDSPRGPFVPVKNGSVTPKEWMCLDGTFFEENGKPYMIFCHEWCQVGDGRMMLVELKPDLSDIIGEPKELFRASSVGRDYFVTDGPFMHRDKDGRLFMTWSNKGSEGYSVYLSKSDSGSVVGPWKNVGKLFSKDGGHGMIFRDLAGGLRFVLHQPNVSGRERMRLFDVREEESGLSIR